ncbi:hypothetical protein [Lignipirellula cremea]|uniref:Uncharacterized protein n=1 Tax=Lignipirellula cremea TaxID=2528010 RepID=A0A518DUH3_9BACT|nr:hypothetical protein [Lignipirellula cremea]QDU95486.1 hypothetical protein Pla8534_33010 [Lignipirellula cremea]
MTTNISTDWQQRRGGLAQNGSARSNAPGRSAKARATQIAGVLGLLFSMSAVGCQVEIGGQTLPSGYYIQDDVQYFAPGPEFVLSQEAAQQKAFKAETELSDGPLADRNDKTRR